MKKNVRHTFVSAARRCRRRVARDPRSKIRQFKSRNFQNLLVVAGISRSGDLGFFFEFLWMKKI